MTEMLSALEQVKAAIDPYAGREVFARLARGTVADITPEDDVVMRWHGLYRHRPQEDGVFMLRLKLPGGFITSSQAKVIAEIAEAHGQVNLTTRQDIEFHRLTLADLPATFDALDAIGLTTMGACGDQVRNVVTCPVAGLDPGDAIDTLATAQAISAAFLANPAFANLPRKFKVSLCGCARHCVPTAINDLGLVAAQHEDGRWGYRVFAGGGLSVQPAMAVDLGVWCAPDDVVTLVTQAVAIFREYGNRQQRGHARVKHLIAERGVPWFLAELETRLECILPRLVPIAAPVGAPDDHLGVQQQQGDGLAYIGVPVPGGRLTTAQMRVIAGIANTLGDRQVRITHLQNLVLPGIPLAHVEQALQQLATIGLPVHESNWAGRLVVCTGKEFCAKAIAHTKSVAIPLALALDRAFPSAGISLRMSGCPNNCGGHAIADIGLQGSLEKTAAGPEERFDLFVGGRATDSPAFGQRLQARLQPDELEDIITDLLRRYRDEAIDHETFTVYARRMLLNNTQADRQ